MAEIELYNQKLEVIRCDCSNIETEPELKEIFKGVLIMFIKHIIQLYNKILIKLPELKFSHSSEKISNLNILLESLEGNGILFNINCNDIILQGYVNYMYTRHREVMINWDLERIKKLNENNIKNVVEKSASIENVSATVSDYLNVIPEVVLIINNLREKEKLKLLYILNNLNIIIDVYLLKKSTNAFL
jgi:hypothetical protein